MNIVLFFIQYFAINQLFVLIINKKTEWMKFSEEDTWEFHPTMPYKMYILICIVGFPMFLFIKQIRDFRINAYKYNRYRQMNFQRFFLSVNDQHDKEFIQLDRYYKLKQLRTSKWKLRLQHWFFV